MLKGSVFPFGGVTRIGSHFIYRQSLSEKKDRSVNFFLSFNLLFFPLCCSCCNDLDCDTLEKSLSNDQCNTGLHDRTYGRQGSIELHCEVQ